MPAFWRERDVPDTPSNVGFGLEPRIGRISLLGSSETLLNLDRNGIGIALELLGPVLCEFCHDRFPLAPDHLVGLDPARLAKQAFS